MSIQKSRTLAATLVLALAAACGGGQERHAADSPAAATDQPADTGVRPMNMIDSASRLPAESLVHLDSARSGRTTPRDSAKRP